MTFSVEEGIFTIASDATMTLAFAGVLLLIGFAIKNAVKPLQKYCIPAPVIGGFLFMIITFIGHQTNAFTFTFTNNFQDTFMLCFFTTVGLGASIELLKKGGIALIVYWLLAGIVSIFQNVIGIGVGKLVGLDSSYALLASAISMIGGHGAAASYGASFEAAGHVGASVSGAASATFGLITAVLVGGPVGRFLVEKHQLKPNEANDFKGDLSDINKEGGKLTNLDIIKNFVVILICMAIGTMVSGWIGKLIKMSFPTYVGAMFVAVIARNLNEKFHWYNFNFGVVDKIGDVSLNMYLSLALMTLKLWDLAGVLGGILAVLVCQVIFLVVVCIFVIFPILGKDYDAAVMCSGMLGHGLGATPSAIVNMTAVNERYGMSRKAMMIVPIVGAFLVDIIYQPQTIWFIKTFVSGMAG